VTHKTIIFLILGFLRNMGEIFMYIKHV
jgi:hypothetical protein